MPKTLVCPKPLELEWREYEEPELKPDLVRVKTEYCAAKHGTEMAIFKGYVCDERGGYDQNIGAYTPGHSFARYPWFPGNMYVGKIFEVGAEIKDVKKGDSVVGYGPFRETHTTRVSDGPREWGTCWKVPAGVSWKSAVCANPADFAFSAVRDGHVRVGDAVAIFGMGAIGLVAVSIAKAAGAHPIFAVDPLKKRLNAAQKLGADYVFDPTASANVGIEIRKITGKRGVDVVIEYSGNRRALQAALACVAYGGNLVAGAMPPPYDAGLDFGTDAHWNIPNIIFSRACSQPDRDHPRWDNNRVYAALWHMICQGKIVGDDIVDPVVPFDKLDVEYPKIASNPELSVKLGAKV